MMFAAIVKALGDKYRSLIIIRSKTLVEQVSQYTLSTYNSRLSQRLSTLVS